MSSVQYIIEFIFRTTLFITALLFIPQLVKIIKFKNLEGVFLLTSIGFLLIQLAIILYGVINKNYLLIIFYLLSASICVVLNIFSSFKKCQLQENRNKNIPLDCILDQMPGHIYWKDMCGVILGSNTNNWKDFGAKSSSDFIGKTDFDLFPKKEAEYMRANDLEVMRTKQLKIIEEPIKKSNGDVVIYLSHKVPLYDHKKQVVGILGISLDVTEDRQKQIERLEFLEDIIALMPGHVYWVNTDNIYLGCNDNQAKSAGLSSRKEIIGKKNKDLPWNIDNNGISASLDNINRQVMDSGKAIMIEEPGLAPDGSELLFLSNKTPIRNRENKVIGMLGISIDITEQRKIQKEIAEAQLKKIEAMTALSAAMAHELRTPFATLDLVASGMKKYFSYLLQGYQLAKNANLPIQPINSTQFELLSKIPNTIEQESKAANLFIDLLLSNVNPKIDEDINKIISVSHCIDEALNRYPFTEEQRKLIHWKYENDFLIKGKEILIIHLLFNLIKNALYFLAKAGKKNNKGIYIWLEKDNHFNRLFFKDTGTGITKDILPYIFNRFFSKTVHGSGIGLTYCKMVMESLGGSIACESEINDYTLFIMSFPVIKV